MNSLDSLKSVLQNGGQDHIEDFMKVIELPDEIFDNIYPKIKEEISKIYSTNDFRENVLKTIEQNPLINPEEEKEAIYNVINDIKEEPLLSENKKDIIISILENSVIKVLELYHNPRKRVNIKIKKLHPDAIIPKYAHELDAGADVCAIEDITLKPNETGVIVKTGIAMEIPAGWEIQVRPRSGMTHKTKLRVGNAPGTIDSCYRGEIGIILDNIGNLSIKIEKGQKIAQLVLAETPMMNFEVVDELSNTERNENGFGSTGEKAES